MEQFAGLTGIVFALTQVVKGFGLSTRFIPVIVIGLGIIVSCLISGFVAPSIIEGLVAGLTASGLYSGAKAVAGK